MKLGEVVRAGAGRGDQRDGRRAGQRARGRCLGGVLAPMANVLEANFYGREAGRGGGDNRRVNELWRRQPSDVGRGGGRQQLAMHITYSPVYGSTWVGTHR